MIPPLFFAPRDPLIPRRNPQRSGRKTRRAKPAMRRANEVADLAAGKGRDPVRMLARDQRVPQGAVRSGRNQPDIKSADLRRMRRNPDRLRYIRRKLARPVVLARGPRPRQNDLRRPLGEGRQRLHAARNLKTAGRIHKRELLADPATQCPPAVKLFLRQNRDNPRACRLAAQGAADLRLCHGDTGIHGRIRVVLPFLS